MALCCIIEMVVSSKTRVARIWENHTDPDPDPFGEISTDPDPDPKRIRPI